MTIYSLLLFKKSQEKHGESCPSEWGMYCYVTEKAPVRPNAKLAFLQKILNIGIGPSHTILHSLLQRTADIHASLVFFDVTPQVNTNYSARTNLLTLNDILGVGIYWCM